MPNLIGINGRWLSVLLVCAAWELGHTPRSVVADEVGDATAEDASAKITHGFLACGQQTYIVDETGQVTWSFPSATRDGYVLPTGEIVLAVNKSPAHPGGAIVMTSRQGGERVLWEGTQSEVNSVQPTPEGTFVLTEAGPKPRLLEIDAAGKIQVEFPLNCQLENFHMQTRMTRKLLDGTYLVPHLLDFVVRNYAADGSVLRELDTTSPNDEQHAIPSWPFTAIRHGEGQTLVCCTHSNTVVQFDAAGQVEWRLTNDDLPSSWLQDPCGAQVLPNGHIVITSYAAGRVDVLAPKLIEVTPDKRVVWTYVDDKKIGIHHFQILDTNGSPMSELPQK